VHPRVSKKQYAATTAIISLYLAQKPLILCEEQMSVKAQEFVKHYFRAIAIPTLCILLAVVCPAQLVGKSHSGREGRLKKFLQNYEGNPSATEERTTRYAAAFVDLNDDGTQEAIVYLISPEWCGSGGCSSLVLEPKGSSFKVITRTTITRLPIRVLSKKTNGWHDLAVWVGGGGIRPGYEARLSFNGKKYPGNPSGPPAQRLQKKTEGKIIIPDNAEGTPLYSD